MGTYIQFYKFISPTSTWSTRLKQMDMVKASFQTRPDDYQENNLLLMRQKSTF